MLEAASAELERSVSPQLAQELHRLVRWDEATAGIGELRIEYASVLGWTSGLVITMLKKLGPRDRPPRVGRPVAHRRVGYSSARGASLS
ncbi:MAG: hypothetical protein ACM3ML_28945 [Micromonosporaceae bacterium]